MLIASMAKCIYTAKSVRNGPTFCFQKELRSLARTSVVASQKLSIAHLAQTTALNHPATDVGAEHAKAIPMLLGYCFTGGDWGRDWGRDWGEFHSRHST